MEINPEQRLEIIKLEMGLIQATLDKYDDLIFRNRNWFITLWMATIGLGFTIKSDLFPLFTVFLSLLYWIIEGMMRHQYWYKYVLRYRTLRDEMNKKPANVEGLTLYDLTNKLFPDHESVGKKLRKSFFKIEPLLLYGAMALFGFLFFVLLRTGVISLVTSA